MVLEPVVNNGINYTNLNWLAGFQPSTVLQDQCLSIVVASSTLETDTLFEEFFPSHRGEFGSMSWIVGRCQQKKTRKNKQPRVIQFKPHERRVNSQMSMFFVKFLKIWVNPHLKWSIGRVGLGGNKIWVEDSRRVPHEANILKLKYFVLNTPWAP